MTCRRGKGRKVQGSRALEALRLDGHREARARRARAACSRAQESLGQLLQQALRGNLLVRVLRSWLLSHLLVDLLQMGTTAASVQHAKRIMTIALKTGVLPQGQQARALSAILALVL